MADQNSTEQRIAGAEAALEVMRKIEALSNFDPADYFAGPRTAVDIAIAGAGVSDPRLAGFLAALVEYIHEVNDGGSPDLERWRPWSAMTTAEREVKQADFAALMAEESRRNVVHLFRGR